MSEVGGRKSEGAPVGDDAHGVPPVQSTPSAQKHRRTNVGGRRSEFGGRNSEAALYRYNHISAMCRRHERYRAKRLPSHFPQE